MGKKRKIILRIILTIALLLTGCGIGLMLDKGGENKKLSAIQMLIDQYYLKDTTDINFQEGIYKGYMQQLGDPYSVYYTEEEYKEMMEDDSGHYVGIGVVVSQNMTTKEVMITRVFAGGPAEKAGLLRYDIIRKVDDVAVADMELTDIVDMIRGGEGESVELSINRDGKEMVIVSERGSVEAKMVEYQMLDKDTGYIVLYEFIETTYDQFVEGYEALEKQGMKNLVLDVRSNPGGLLDQVHKISDYFLPAGSVVVSTEDKHGEKDILRAEDDIEKKIPMVVLTDPYSASASEILIAVVRDYKLGTVMGQRTYGKGIVQRMYPLADGSAVKLTISKYFTPNGDYIHEKGINPDVEIKDMYIEQKGDTIMDDTWIQAAMKELDK